MVRMIAKVPATPKKHLTFIQDNFVKKMDNYLHFISLFQQALTLIGTWYFSSSSIKVQYAPGFLIILLQA